jgi:hypothetical protein
MRRGVFVPVKNYECLINTGTARPISVKKILCGERKTIIMCKCIVALAKVRHIVQTTDGQWLFEVLLAAKPHQEHIRSIDEFIWRFCVNFIPLNSITKLIAYPIPRCNLAFTMSLGKESGVGCSMRQWISSAGSSPRESGEAHIPRC